MLILNLLVGMIAWSKPWKITIMTDQNLNALAEINIHRGFNPASRKMLTYWEDKVIDLHTCDECNPAVSAVNRTLEDGNLILFFDHHYAFDALPLGLGLARIIKGVTGVMIPYAVHLDMALGREGEPSRRYQLRTRAFQWLKNHISQGCPQIRFMPVVREFEMDTPRLRSVVDEKYQGVSTSYLRAFIRVFSKYAKGQVSFLSPFAGIGFPGKLVLHPVIFKSIALVREKSKEKISFCFTGAYPDWAAFDSYIAPLLIPHKILISKPFSLPGDGYEEAKCVVEEELDKLRKSADFTPPDYEKILLK